MPSECFYHPVFCRLKPQPCCFGSGVNENHNFPSFSQVVFKYNAPFPSFALWCVHKSRTYKHTNTCESTQVNSHGIHLPVWTWCVHVMPSEVYIYFYTLLLRDLRTVHPTCHALYMCCVNVHVSLYILCHPNWHAVGPSSCEALYLCVWKSVCVLCIALSKAPASSRPPGHNGLQLPPSPPV